jgi:hypothetical protein
MQRLNLSMWRDWLNEQANENDWEINFLAQLEK